VTSHFLLGIDTGGTYTDAVLFHETDGVIAKAKSLTTRHDLAIGLSVALDAVIATAADLDYAPKLLGIPWLFAGAASLFMPFIHALGGFMVGVVLAMIYNFAARWTGGIEIVLDDNSS